MCSNIRTSALKLSRTNRQVRRSRTYPGEFSRVQVQPEEARWVVNVSYHVFVLLQILRTFTHRRNIELHVRMGYNEERECTFRLRHEGGHEKV